VDAATTAELALVRRFWALYQKRQWLQAQTLLSPSAQCRWWATRERFEGAAAIVYVNAVYPEGWEIKLLEINLLGDGRVHSLIRVDHAEATFYANSFFRLHEQLIVALDEYWSDVQLAPAWRNGAALPGLQAMATDSRAGLALL